MENASKALIIAGAILISILIIAIGMYIYTSSSSSIYGATSQMNSQEITAFNQGWTNYEGTQTGSNCRTLVSQIIANNSTNKDDQTKIIGIEITDKTGTSILDLSSTEIAGDENLKASDIQAARNKMEIKHKYTVKTEVDTTTAIINKIKILYNESDESNN